MPAVASGLDLRRTIRAGPRAGRRPVRSRAGRLSRASSSRSGRRSRRRSAGAARPARARSPRPARVTSSPIRSVRRRITPVARSTARSTRKSGRSPSSSIVRGCSQRTWIAARDRRPPCRPTTCSGRSPARSGRSRPGGRRSRAGSPSGGRSPARRPAPCPGSRDRRDRAGGCGWAAACRACGPTRRSARGRRREIQISYWPPPTSPGRLVVTRACPGWRSSTSTWVASSPRAEIAVSTMRIRSVAKRSSASRMNSNSSSDRRHARRAATRPRATGVRRRRAGRAARSHSRVSVIAPDCTGACRRAVRS